MSVKKDGDIVGHLPRKISHVFAQFSYKEVEAYSV